MEFELLFREVVSSLQIIGPICFDNFYLVTRLEHVRETKKFINIIIEALLRSSIQRLDAKTGKSDNFTVTQRP